MIRKISLVIFFLYPYTTAVVFELSVNHQRVWCVVSNLSRYGNMNYPLMSPTFQIWAETE